MTKPGLIFKKEITLRIDLNNLFQQKKRNKIFCFFSLFFRDFEQNERARELITDHLF